MPSKKSSRPRNPLSRSGFLSASTERMKPWLSPMFVTIKLRKAIEKLLPVEHYKRLRLYFDTYGCLACRRKAMIYGANGFCKPCLGTIEKRLRILDGKLQASVPVRQPDLADQFVRPYRTACELLADLIPRVSPRLGQTKAEPKALPRVYLGRTMDLRGFPAVKAPVKKKTNAHGNRTTLVG